jgi:RNA ligase (TIGR02306 family)
MNKSTHKVEIVPIRLERHPNAETLSIVRIFAGYTCCVRTADWEGKTTGAYIPPDSVVDSSRPEFAFLTGQERIKVKKLRGIVSMGLLVPAPEGAQLGDDVAEQLGVTHYDPPMPLSTGGEAESPPKGYRPVFDVDSLRRYAHVFVPGEPVFISEKIHGASGKWCWYDGRMYCGSRTEWKREDPKNLWWRALWATPRLEVFCREHPNITVYGEVYGQVQDLKYGAKKDDVRIAVFDLLHDGQWINPQQARDIGMLLPWVPTIEEAEPFNLTNILALAEGDSRIIGANHVREGIVVKSITERTHPEIGRVCLKVVGNGYLERK